MWFLAYKSPFLQGTYTFLRFSDLLIPIGVTSFNLGPGTVFSYNGLWMILSQLTVWDTYGMSPGFNDNGSGVAAILEIARILASATCYKVGENITYILFGKKWQGTSLRFFQV